MPESAAKRRIFSKLPRQYFQGLYLCHPTVNESTYSRQEPRNSSQGRGKTSIKLVAILGLLSFAEISRFSPPAKVTNPIRLSILILTAGFITLSTANSVIFRDIF